MQYHVHKERVILKNGKDKEVYKYNGSVCGASFAIPQIAGLFLLARQIDKKINFDEFVEIVKNPKRVNKDGKMYLDAKEVIEEIKYRSRKNTNLTEISTEEYVKKSDKHEVHPTHVVTTCQITEAGIDKNIALEDTEQAGVLIDSLSAEKGNTKSH